MGGAGEYLFILKSKSLIDLTYKNKPTKLQTFLFSKRADSNSIDTNSADVDSNCADLGKYCGFK